MRSSYHLRALHRELSSAECKYIAAQERKASIDRSSSGMIRNLCDSLGKVTGVWVEDMARIQRSIGAQKCEGTSERVQLLQNELQTMDRHYNKLCAQNKAAIAHMQANSDSSMADACEDCAACRKRVVEIEQRMSSIRQHVKANWWKYDMGVDNALKEE